MFLKLRLKVIKVSMVNHGGIDMNGREPVLLQIVPKLRVPQL